MAKAKTTKSRGPARGRRGRAAGTLAAAANETWISAHDTIVNPSKRMMHARAARGQGNLREIDSLLNEFTKVLAAAKSASHVDSLIGLVTHAEKLLAVARFIGPEGMESVFRHYEKKLLPVSEAMYARCRAKRVLMGSE